MAEPQNYAERLLTEFKAVKNQESGAGLTVLEMYDGLRGKMALSGKSSLSAAEQRLLSLCQFARSGPRLERRLQSDPAAAAATAAFARERGLSKTAWILDQALRELAAGREYTEQHWERANRHLHLLATKGESLGRAIIDYVEENLATIQLPVPLSMQRADALATQLAALAATSSASKLIAQLLTHRQPRLYAQPMTSGMPDAVALEIAVCHRANAPADSQLIGGLRHHYGAAANELLDLYSDHNGGDFFMLPPHQSPVLRVEPVERWRANMNTILTWLTDAKEPPPDFLHNAIPFCRTDGISSAFWLLITRGDNAGDIVPADRNGLGYPGDFESLRHFFATLILAPCEQLICDADLSLPEDRSLRCRFYSYEFQ